MTTYDFSRREYFETLYPYPVLDLMRRHLSFALCCPMDIEPMGDDMGVS